MSSKVERLVVVRRQLLANNLIGLVVWQGASLMREVLPPQHPLVPVGIVLSLGGAVYWTLFLWRITEMQRQLRDDRATTLAMEDELVRRNRLQAGVIAFGAVVALQGVWLAVLSFQPHLVSGLFVAQASMLLGIAAFIGAFLYLDSKEG